MRGLDRGAVSGKAVRTVAGEAGVEPAANARKFLAAADKRGVGRVLEMQWRVVLTQTVEAELGDFVGAEARGMGERGDCVIRHLEGVSTGQGVFAASQARHDGYAGGREVEPVG